MFFVIQTHINVLELGAIDSGSGERRTIPNFIATIALPDGSNRDKIAASSQACIDFGV
jgi:hypothetical protein